jgi:hypothetical protein
VNCVAPLQRLGALTPGSMSDSVLLKETGTCLRFFST